MCGIAGFVNRDGAPADEAVLAEMMALIRHRGPDDRGRIRLSLRRGEIAGDDLPADAGIGFHRLSILDLSPAGLQPMVNASGTVVVVLNGEIYNAFDYKAELEAAGFRFRSRTDTEVVLYLYERYGLDEMLERLSGMFALAIADLRASVVHLARDHFGIKPLYWAEAGSSVLFASEAKAFLAHPAFTARLDEDHVDEQLAFRYVSGDGSLFKGVRQLRPGHHLTISPRGLTTTRYWSLADDVEPALLGRDEAADQLEPLLRRSVLSQLVSDVNVGCQVSGGIDSSLVTAYAQTHARTALDTFSVVFDDPKFSEEAWIDELTAVTGIRSHRFRLSETSFINPLISATWHMDQPISHPNSLGIWLLAEQAGRQVTVLLSGEGADEVFAGYPRFQFAHLRSTLGDAARRLTSLRVAGERPSRHFSGELVDAFIRASQFQPQSKLARLRPDADLAPALARRRALFDEGSGHHLANCLKYEMQTHLVDLLMRQDKMTMAHGVENRVPFLDRRVVAFARTLPAARLVGEPIPSSGAPALSTKIILKDLARRQFGDAFANRPKGAFALPLSQYFRSQPFVELMEDALLPGMKQRGVVSEPAVRQLWRRALSAPALTEPFWIPVALELWAQQFLDGRRGAAQPSA